MPLLSIIGGPNGSGKTTLTKYLINKGRIKAPVINPDEIALHELGGCGNHIGTARIALDRRKKAITEQQDLAFETTFSGQSEINDIKSANNSGYKVILYYVALKSALDNVIRVQERQSDRGHNVENEDIVRRYQKSRLSLILNIGLFDKIYLFDNSNPNRSRVAVFVNGRLVWLNPTHQEHPFYRELSR